MIKHFLHTNTGFGSRGELGMYRTNNLNIKGFTEVVAPAQLKQVFPQSYAASEFVAKSRQQIIDVLDNRDKRLMVLVGPCSIHDSACALDYARRLAKLKDELNDQLLL